MENPPQHSHPEIPFGKGRVPRKNRALQWARVFVWLSPAGAISFTLAMLILTRDIFDGVGILWVSLGLNLLFTTGAGVCEACLQGKRGARGIIGVAAGFSLLQVLWLSSLCGVVERFFRI